MEIHAKNILKCHIKVRVRVIMYNYEKELRINNSKIKVRSDCNK